MDDAGCCDIFLSPFSATCMSHTLAEHYIHPPTGRRRAVTLATPANAS